MEKRKKILVTGGAGYVGSVLVPYLLHQGYDVRVFDLLIYGDVGLAGVKDNIEIIEGTIMHPPEGLMDDIFAVIHLAGVASQAFSSTNSPRYTDKINHIGTEIMASYAKQKGVERFILASSCSVYCSYTHELDTRLPLYKETDIPPMAGPYALSKWAAEEVLLEMADTDFHPVIFRMGTLYGFSPKMRYDLVVNAFTKDAFVNKKMNVHAGGEIFRPLTDIHDVVFAYTRALELPVSLIDKQIFNISGENKKLGDLAQEVQTILEKKTGEFIAVDVQPFQLVMNYKADNAKFIRVFDWKPERTLAEAVEEIWSHLDEGHEYENNLYYTDTWHKEMLARGLTDRAL